MRYCYNVAVFQETVIQNKRIHEGSFFVNASLQIIMENKIDETVQSCVLENVVIYKLDSERSWLSTVIYCSVSEIFPERSKETKDRALRRVVNVDTKRICFRI